MAEREKAWNIALRAISIPHAQSPFLPAEVYLVCANSYQLCGYAIAGSRNAADANVYGTLARFQ